MKGPRMVGKGAGLISSSRKDVTLPTISDLNDLKESYRDLRIKYESLRIDYDVLVNKYRRLYHENEQLKQAS